MRPDGRKKQKTKKRYRQTKNQMATKRDCNKVAAKTLTTITTTTAFVVLITQKATKK